MSFEESYVRVVLMIARRKGFNITKPLSLLNRFVEGNLYKRRKVACLTAYYQSLLTLNLIL